MRLYAQGKERERAVIGIDISKQKFDCLWLRDVRSLNVKTKVFANRPTEFAELINWCCAQTGERLQVFLEATGVYHEPLTLYLHDRGVQVFVLNPGSRAKRWQHP